jgi:hypothetical protein
MSNALARDLAVPAEWTDVSGDDHTSFETPRGLTVNVEHVDAKLRSAPEFPRFAVQAPDPDWDTLLCTDSWDDVLAFVRLYKAGVDLVTVSA